MGIRDWFRRTPTIDRNDRLIEKMASMASGQRRDAWMNIITKAGVSGHDKSEAGQHFVNPVPYEEARGLWRGDYLGKKIANRLPRAAMRKGYGIALADAGASTKKKIEQLNANAEDLRLDQHFVSAGRMNRALGGAALMPLFLDGSTSSAATPLPPDGPLPKIRSWIKFEPKELHPEDYFSDPFGENFGMPSIYRVRPLRTRGGSISTMDLRIHASRLIIFPGDRETREEMEGVEPGWGDNCYTPMRQVLQDYHLSWKGLVALLADFAQGVFKMNGLAQLVEAGQDDEVITRLVLVDYARSILRALVVDKEDDFQRTSTTLAGFPESLELMMCSVAAAADETVTSLFGRSPAGMDATGESDITQDDDRTIAYQGDFKPLHERMISMLMRQKDGPFGGKEPEQWSVKYNPLRQLSEEQEAGRRKTIAETDVIYEAMGVPAKDIIQSRFKGDTYSSEMHVDWAALDAQLAVKQEMAQAAAAALTAGAGGADDPDDDPDEEGDAAAGDGFEEEDDARGDSALSLDAGAHSGTMVALHLSPDLARELAVTGGLAPDELHITLAYLGKELTQQQKEATLAVVSDFAAGYHGPLGVKLGGIGRFNASESSEGLDVLYISVNSPPMVAFREAMLEELAAVGVVPRTEHAYTPHVTLAYIPTDAPLPISRVPTRIVEFRSIAVSIGDQRTSFQLGD